MPVAKRSRKTLKKRLQKRKRPSRRRLRKQRGGVRLFITGPSGRTHALNLEPGEPVGALKPLLEELEGLTPLEQHLSFSGAPLDDGRSITDSGLGEDAAIQLARVEPFVMPRWMNQITGDLVPDFGPPIEGSLAEWRRANPHALIANIAHRDDITDEDFVHLRGIKALTMGQCNQEMNECDLPFLTDRAFENLVGIKYLDISYCNQPTITDRAFENLRGIQYLNMAGCNQPTITDQAFENLRGIHTLILWSLDQDTITDAAFENLRGIHTLEIGNCLQFTDNAFQHLQGIHTLKMLYCNQPTITDRAFTYLHGIHKLSMQDCDQPTITDRAFEEVVFAPDSQIEYLYIRGMNRQTVTAPMRTRLRAVPGLHFYD